MNNKIIAGALLVGSGLVGGAVTETLTNPIDLVAETKVIVADTEKPREEEIITVEEPITKVYTTSLKDLEAEIAQITEYKENKQARCNAEIASIDQLLTAKTSLKEKSEVELDKVIQ